MKVNHRTFTGGYKFGSFEGQASGAVLSFTPKGNVTDLAIQAGEGVTAATVLDTLNLTSFQGPASALVPTEGTIEPSMVKDIVISAVEVEPYDLPGSKLLNGSSVIQFTDGLKAIKESYPEARVHLVASADQKELINVMAPIADNLSWLEVYDITPKYPANMKELQIQTVLEKKYPVGYAPAHLGCLFLSLGDVFTVESVFSGEAAGTTVVALAGTGWKENVIVEVPVGTSVKELTSAYLGDDEVRLVKNSVITGDVLTSEDVVNFDLNVLIALPEDRRRQTLFFLRAGKTSDSFTNAFLGKLFPKAEKTAETNLHGERRACVSCTYCQNVCPVGLIPHLLHKHVNKDIINERLAEYEIFNCIECGLCDYVCPSKIDVSVDIKKGKEKLEKFEISHTKYQLPGCDMILEPVSSDSSEETGSAATTKEEVAAGE